MFNFVNNLEQILPVLVLYHRLCHLAKALGSYPSFAVCNTLETGNLQSLAFLYHLDKD